MELVLSLGMSPSATFAVVAAGAHVAVAAMVLELQALSVAGASTLPGPALRWTHHLSADDPCRWATMERQDGLVQSGFCPLGAIVGLSSSISFKEVAAIASGLRTSAGLLSFLIAVAPLPLPLPVLQRTHHLSAEGPRHLATIERQEGPVHMGPWEFLGRLPSTIGLTLVLNKQVSAFGILLSWFKD